MSDRFELARVTLDVYDEQLGDAYHQARAELAGALVGNQIHLEGLRATEAARRQNFNLVSEFVQQLPRAASGSAIAIEVQDASEARQVQANAIWVKEPYSFDSSSGSYHSRYMIGSRPVTGENYTGKALGATELLLFSTSLSSTRSSLRSIIVRDDELSLALKGPQSRLGQDFKEHEIDNMFHAESGMLRVGLYPRGEVVNTRLLTRMPLPLGPYWLRDPAKVIRDKGIHAVSAGEFDERIDNVDMESFDVFTSLNRLALAFDRKDVLSGLLKTYQDKADTRTE